MKLCHECSWEESTDFRLCSCGSKEFWVLPVGLHRRIAVLIGETE